MTPRQIELARHALGLPNKAGRTYRNRFYASAGHADYADWVAMVEAGNAIRHDAAGIGNDLFCLTRLGASAALIGRETLDREDFPA